MEKLKLIESDNLKRRPPVNLTERDSSLFLKQFNFTLPEVNLFHYKDACVTPEGIIFKNLKVEKQFLIYPYHKKIYNSLYLISSILKREKINLPLNEKFILCFDYWSNSIFHWMCDALPRLQAIKNMAKDCIFLLPEHYKYTYIHETLKAFELKSIYIFPTNSFLKCPNLYVPEQITVSGKINPTNFRELRKTLLDYFQPKFKGISIHKNIYISRRKAKYRKVLNEDKLLDLLKKYDFSIINYEDFSVLEQIEIAFNAKNIVSIHGANLTNCIFLQPNSNVLEFRKENDSENNYFYEIVDSVNCNYFYQSCKCIDNEPEKNLFDLIVDLELLESNLNLMLNYHK